MGRVLAVDYGTKRVGLAVTDPLKIIASALDTVHSKDVIQYLDNLQFNFAFESVFNIQLEDSSACFIGEKGLWVHC
mgnify:CR=1 FL=1